MSTVAPADVLAVFDRRDEPGTPLTAPEVAEALGCARRTAHEKLTRLAERDALATKKVGARGRVWWRPASRRAEAADSGGVDGVEDVPQEAGRGAEAPTGDRTHRRALRELHDASRRLMRAETRETVCEVAVDAARRILGLPLNGIWLYDPDRNALDPVEWTEPGVEEFGEPATFPVDGSLAGRAFRGGDCRVYDDVTAEAEPYDPETRVRAELILPLSEYGVLIASSLEVGTFDAVDVSLGRILAANVETALERADQLAARRARRRELERRRDELETLNQLNALVEDTIGALVDAATRAEIEDTVCERLAGSAFYVDAWIVERGSTPGSVVPRTGAAGDGGTADLLAGTDAAIPGPNPVATAIEERAPQVVPRLADDERVPEELRAAALERGARACLAVPLAYADTVFGALVVHAPEPDGFSERERAAFETLGRVVGFVINATNSRRLLLGTTAVELEVALRETTAGRDTTDTADGNTATADPDTADVDADTTATGADTGDGDGDTTDADAEETAADPGAWFLDAAARLGGTVAVEGLVPTDDGTLTEYVTVEGATDDADPDDLAGMPAVADTRVLAADDDRWFVECTVRTGEGGLGVVADYGASVRTARASGGMGTVTARFPASTSPREALAVVREAFPDAELVAKRVVDVSDRSVATIRQTVAERLTDKQSAALRAALLAGYYDSPRRTTGQELADSLDVAPSTLHQHLQAAQRKLLATVFDDLSAD